MSQFFAQNTDVWHIRNSKSSVFPKSNKFPAFDKVRLFKIVENLAKESAQWPRFFEYFSIRPIVIEYEDVLHRYPFYLEPLFNEIGLNLAGSTPSRRMLKLGDSLSIEYREKLRAEFLSERGVVI